MALKFQRTYGPVNFVVSGNACFVARNEQRASYSRCPQIALGHLSNLCAEKGFFLTADLFETLAKEFPSMTFKIAGPIVAPEVDVRLRELLNQFPDQVAYVGAVYGRAKQEFFQTIDAFVFPTLYPLEAQPNVIYEAMASGNLILATDRGCIAEMVPAGAGLVIADPSKFTNETAAFVRANVQGRNLTAQKAEIIKHFEQERLKASSQFSTLLELFA
nr:glycosyltransferase family 4 protein [Bradyrhizobium sp. 160]